MPEHPGAGTGLEELLTPSIGERRAFSGPSPWRVHSQLWVAFFGGVLAVTAIAWVNAGRLRMEPRRRRWIPVIALAALAVILGFWLRRPPTGATFFWWMAGARDIRLYSRIVAVVAYLLYARLQRRDDRAFGFFNPAPYASLWKAGLAATVVLGFVEPFIPAGIAWLVK